jgi:hypothetical protein
LDKFGLKSAGTLGRQSWCKECVSEYKRDYKHKQRLLNFVNKVNKVNKEKLESQTVVDTTN